MSSGVFPIRVLSNKFFNALVLLFCSVFINGSEVIKNEKQDLAWTGNTYCSSWNIEAIKPKLDAMSGISIILFHPLYKFTIRFKTSKTLTKSCVLYLFVRFWSVT